MSRNIVRMQQEKRRVFWGVEQILAGWLVENLLGE